jgi:hypothetical protein
MNVKMGSFDRRSLFMLAAGLLTIVILRLIFSGDAPTQVVAASDSIPMAEKRLERLRQIAATVPGKETVLKNATADLEAREKGILKVDTAAQAQAQLLEIISGVGRGNGIDVRGAQEMREARPLGDDYAEVSVAVSFKCQIDQLVNLLASLANEPQALSTSDIRISGNNDKKKVIEVRLTVSGVVPRTVLPKRGQRAS